MVIKVLDLFSGIGGFSLGLERAGMETMAFCEINSYCRKILRKHWPDTPIFEDIKSLSADDLPARPDLICGGYPCQPFSVAGKQRGKDDDRHLWPEMFRLIKECRPRWFIGENVAGHIRLGLDDVLSDLERENYTWQTFVIPACAVNAPHRRDRVWIVAHCECEPLRDKTGEDLQQEKPVRKESWSHGLLRSVAEDVGHSQHYGLPAAEIGGIHFKDAGEDKEGQESSVESEGEGQPGSNEVLAHTESQRIQGRGASGKQESSSYARQKLPMRPGQRSWETQWKTEPAVGRVANGIPNRVDRIRALGNSLVPQIPEIIGRAIIATMK